MHRRRRLPLASSSFCLLHRLLSSPVRSCLSPGFVTLPQVLHLLAIDPAARALASGVTATIGVRDCWLGSDSWVVGAVCIFAGALSVDLTWYHGEEEESVWTGVDLLSRLSRVSTSRVMARGVKVRLLPGGSSLLGLLLGLCLMAGFRSQFLGFGHFHFAFGRSYYWFSDVGACEEPLFSELSPEFSWFLWQHVKSHETASASLCWSLSSGGRHTQ
ncbi:LOW QUALITY PROTEIN: hypothetical protein HID58_051368 [Brassica napus]|uniref:Uncharacterized protein n=1 Tax=Brassica napus TaxID=3708 RepID=A0ABQ8A916_BRANA|nr:LOW QUALITY PROTEIN: hypothetical protein HID58_051368 [Brassica napus]